MPGNCGTEARCFRYSTYWFREEYYFSIAAVSTEILVETTKCLRLSCDAFSFYNERPG